MRAAAISCGVFRDALRRSKTHLFVEPQVLAADHSDRVASLVLGATWARLDARLRQLFMFRKRAVGEWAPGEVGQPQPVRPHQLAGWGAYQQDTHPGWVSCTAEWTGGFGSWPRFRRWLGLVVGLWRSRGTACASPLLW